MLTPDNSKTFADLITGMAHGEVDDAATKELKTLVSEMEQVQRNGIAKCKGKIVMTINFTLDRGTYALETSCKRTSPPTVRPQAFLYPTRDGTLSEEDLRQYQLGIGAPKDVSTGAATDVRNIEDRRRAASGERD